MGRSTETSCVLCIFDPATGKLSTEDTTLYALSSRSRTQPIGGSVEAPFVVKRGPWWYLFVSFDRCCRGAQSTYNVVVGRAAKVTGPYLDQSGKPMAEGGGTPVLEATTPEWRGPGHRAIVGDLMLYHAYQGQTGRPHLRIAKLTWDEGWPRATAKQ